MRLEPKVLIVEDEPEIAELIAVNLRHNGFRLTWVMDSASAQRELDDVLPDVILLDWMLPGESGLLLAKRWRANPRTQAVPIIMLTARDGEMDRVAGLDAGADDYISKPFSTKELVARLRAVLRRKALAPSEVPLSIGSLLLDAASHRVSYAGQVLRLGPTEFKILHYLMRHAERVHSRARLLDHVWGDQVFIEERTVDVHVKRLRDSLGPEVGRMVETVRGVGYRLTAQVEVATTLQQLSSLP